MLSESGLPFFLTGMVGSGSARHGASSVLATYTLHTGRVLLIIPPVTARCHRSKSGEIPSTTTPSSLRAKQTNCQGKLTRPAKITTPSLPGELPQNRPESRFRTSTTGDRAGSRKKLRPLPTLRAVVPHQRGSLRRRAPRRLTAVATHGW